MLFDKKENELSEEYDFGEAKRHAGPIDKNTIKELHRLERLLEIENILDDIEHGK